MNKFVAMTLTLNLRSLSRKSYGCCWCGFIACAEIGVGVGRDSKGGGGA